MRGFLLFLALFCALNTGARLILFRKMCDFAPDVWIFYLFYGKLPKNLQIGE